MPVRDERSRTREQDQAGHRPAAGAGEQEEKPLVRAVTHRAKIITVAWNSLLALTVALALGGLLVGTQPVWRHNGSGTAATVSLVQTVSRIALRLEVDPAAFGPNRVLLALRDAHNRPVQDAQVRLALDMIDMPMGTLAVTAAPVGGGRYQALPRLIMPGHWRIRVIVRGPGLPAQGVQATFQLTAAAQAAGPVPTALPVVGGPASATRAVTISPAAVRWPATLPYRAVVSFLDNGLVYVPGHAALLRVGQLNHTVAVGPVGSLWVTDYMGSRVAVLAPQTGRLIGSIPTGIGPVHIAFTPDGHRAFVSNYLSSNVAVVDVRTRRVLRRVAVGMWPHSLAVTPDGRQVWVPCGGAASLSVIDTHTDRVTHTYIAGLMPHAVAFSPDGRTVYMTDARPGDLVVLDRASGVVRARVPIRTGSAMVAVSLDGRRVYVTGQGGNALTVVDAATHRIVRRVPVGGAPHGLVLTPDGRFVYVAVNKGRHVTVVETRTERVVATVPVPGTANELALWR
jgi:YVTN family beta-propeller protein